MECELSGLFYTPGVVLDPRMTLMLQILLGLNSIEASHTHNEPLRASPVGPLSTTCKTPSKKELLVGLEQ